LNHKQRKPDLDHLLKACRRLSNILDLSELIGVYTGMIVETLETAAVVVLLRNRGQDRFEPVHSHGVENCDCTMQPGDPDLEDAQSTGEPQKVSGDAPRLRWDSAAGAEQTGGSDPVLWIPLVVRRDLIGLTVLGSRKQGEPYSESDEYFLRELTAHAAICIHTCRLYEKRRKEKDDLRKTLQNLSLLYNIGKAMNFISDLKKLLKYILSQAIDITRAEKGSIMLYDPENRRLNVRVLAGLTDQHYQERVNNHEISCRSFRPGEGIAGRVYASARPMVVNDIRQTEEFVESEASFVKSIACIPMVVYHDVIGVINVTNKHGESGFTAEDVEMLKAVADQAAVAINKAQLWDLAVTDSVTGLYVRRYFMVKLQEEIHRAQRYHKSFAVVMADIDRFKSINDTYGHDAGDRALQHIARMMQRNIREVDTLARYGGEEFVMLMPDSDKSAAASLAERLRQTLGDQRLDDLPRITASFGIAAYPADASEVGDLIKKSDAALYAAKMAGRNRVVQFGPDIETAFERRREAT
jgi:diguanylate cyclase (GGDEF)-like protein